MESSPETASSQNIDSTVLRDGLIPTITPDELHPPHTLSATNMQPPAQQTLQPATAPGQNDNLTVTAPNGRKESQEPLSTSNKLKKDKRNAGKRAYESRMARIARGDSTAKEQEWAQLTDEEKKARRKISALKGWETSRKRIKEVERLDAVYGRGTPASKAKSTGKKSTTQNSTTNKSTARKSTAKTSTKPKAKTTTANPTGGKVFL